MTTLSYAARTAVLVGALAPLGALTVGAQVAPRSPRPPEMPMPGSAPRVYIAGAGAGIANRGILGISLRTSSGAADTLGLLVDDVEDGLPADKAGITRGARLVSVDGVDLRLDPRDLDDSAAEALPETRLRRLIGRKEPGDTITLVVLTDGRKETKRVALAESPMARTLRGLSSGRRVLGLGFAQRGSMRDTAGLLIVSISTGGAADKAGLIEGDRIVSIDGVDLRIPAGDAGSPEAVEARISRLRRALDAARDSTPVRLEVLSEGRRRTVSVVPSNERGFTFSTAGFQGMADDIRASVRANMQLFGERSEAASARAEVQREMTQMQREQARELRERAREQAEEQRERAQEQGERVRERAQEQRERAREQAERVREQAREQARMHRDQMRRDDDSRDAWSRDDDDDDGPRGARGTVRGRTDGATLSLSGLSLAIVDRDFAQQFGRGSEDGALVVRTRDSWDPIKVGDVILKIDGRGVRDGNGLDVSFDRGRDQRIEILRNGRRETITLRAAR